MTQNAPIDSVEELLPHRSPMLLLDGVLELGSDVVIAYVDHAKPSILSLPCGRTPIWAGIEYMAQTIGLYGGLESKRRGSCPQIGFLLGTRKFIAHSQSFEVNQRAIIRAEKVFQSADNIVQFHCTITSNGQLVAESDIKAIQPENPEELLKQI